MMRRLFDEILLVRALRSLSGRSSRGAAALFIALGAAAAASLAVPFSEALTSAYMADHHFRPRSWPVYGVTQALPKMYSFAHTCWIGHGPLLEVLPQSSAEDRFARESFWVNHYPARRARFDSGRGALGPGAVRYVYMRTSYFGHTETTRIKVSVRPGELAFDVKRLDEAP